MEGQKKHGKPPCRFKIPLTKSSYNLLTENFSGQSDWSQVIYVYFDTDRSQDEAKLFATNLRLRVRIKGERYSLELKYQPLEDRWEFFQKLTLAEFHGLMQGDFPAGEIRQRLEGIISLTTLRWVGAANTIRQKISFQNGVLVLDQTSLAGNTYYQVEFRSEVETEPAQIEIIHGWLDSLVGEDTSSPSKLDELWATRAYRQKSKTQI